jgi:isopropylmalate/homocitrate/citramalate synthase
MTMLDDERFGPLKSDVARAQQVLDAMPPKPIRRLDAAWHREHRPSYYAVVVEKHKRNKPSKFHVETRAKSRADRIELARRLAEYLRNHGRTMSRDLAKAMGVNPIKLAAAAATIDRIRWDRKWDGAEKTYWITGCTQTTNQETDK